ncbi:MULTISPECIES: transcription termination/antitermination NusG family protein [Pseudomonadota]|uniref:transcription termination/antitermination NusG family protein n=1 Tax=Pseudomonadota TaxID=1224 RepID=UPI003298E277
MTHIATIPVTAALKSDYQLMRALVAVHSLDWIVVYTNPACEERAMASMNAAGLIVYRPMEPVIRKHARTKKRLDVSRGFFPRYVFVALDRSATQNAEMVRDCDGVESILTFHLDRRPHIVPVRQMQVIMEAAWTAQTAREYKVPQSFDLGESIRMTTGSFENLEGVVTAYHEAKGMVTADTEMMGRTVSVLAPVDNCRKVR